MKNSPTATRKPVSTTGAMALWKKEPSSRPTMARSCAHGADRPGRASGRRRRGPDPARRRSGAGTGPPGWGPCPGWSAAGRRPRAPTRPGGGGPPPGCRRSAPRPRRSVMITSSTPATAARAAATACAVAVPGQDHGAAGGAGRAPPARPAASSSATRRPRSRISTRSQTAATSLRMWLLSSTVRRAAEAADQVADARRSGGGPGRWWARPGSAPRGRRPGPGPGPPACGSRG